MFIIIIIIIILYMLENDQEANMKLRVLSHWGMSGN